MSVAKNFYAVAEKLRTYKVKFGEKTSASAVKRLVFTDKYQLPSGLTALKTYYEGGVLFALLSNGKLYREDNGVFVVFVDTVFTEAPRITDISFSGTERFLVTGRSGGQYRAFVSGEIGTVTVPQGSNYIVCNGRLFSAEDYTLNFSEPFDLTDFELSSAGGGYIRVEKADGKICALSVSDGKLVIFCENKILNLICDGEKTDFTLKRTATFSFSARKNTVAAEGDTAAFFSGDSLFTYYKGSLKKVNTGLTGVNFSVGETLNAAFADGIYMLPVSFGGENKLFCYDVYEDGEYYLGSVSALSDKGGYAYNATTSKIMKIGSSLSSVSAVDPYNNDYDFDSCEEKRLVYLSAKTYGTASITVTGENGEETFALSDGCNEKRLNMLSREFSVSISSRSNGFALERLIFKYKIKGE